MISGCMQVPDPAFKVLGGGEERQEGGRKEEHGKRKAGRKEEQGKRAKAARVKEEEEGVERREEARSVRREQGGARERAEARMLQEALQASLGAAPAVCDQA